MKTALSLEFLKGLVAVGGIFSAVVAAPFLYAAGERREPVERFALDVTGLKNAGDSERIRRELKGSHGLVSIQCDHLAGLCRAEINPAKIRKEDVAVKINKLGFQAYLQR